MFGDDDLFGGLFDLDGDGKTSFGEAFVLHELFASDEELKLEYGEPTDDTSFSLEDDEDEESDSEILDEDNYQLDDDIDSFDDSEDENDNLYSDNGSDSITVPVNISINIGSNDSQNTVKRSDYPNERMYKAADMLDSIERYPDIYSKTDYSKEIAKCRFLLDNPNITAAKYLNYEYGFLFAQAVKERFKLPIDIPYDDDEINTTFPELFRKIARYNIEYAIRIWHWVLTMFSPYIKYGDDSDAEELTSFVMCDIDEEQLRVAAIYAEGHPHFISVFLNTMTDLPSMMEEWICFCIQSGSKNTAKVLFEGCLSSKNIPCDVKESFVSSVLENACNYNETDTAKYFRDVLLPVTLRYADKPMKRKMSEWQSEISEYIRENESESDSDDLKAEHMKQTEQSDAEFKHRMAVCREIENGNEVASYTYCAVLLPSVPHPYYYRVTDSSIKIGDKVIVPVGEENKELTGTVVSVEVHTELTVPFPLNKTKIILKKI